MKNNYISIFSLSYLILPLLIFYFGWLKLPFAIIASIITIFSGYKIYKSLNDESFKVDKKIVYKIISLILIVLWVYLSGIGGYAYQRWDFFVRNPIFNDLIKSDWPLTINLSTNSTELQQLTGSGSVAFIYYFSWWLPVCLIAKIYNLSNGVANFLLFLHAIIGIVLILHEMNKYLKKYSYTAIILLILFSGLDMLMYYFLRGTSLWWGSILQFNSNTTMLLNRFNQVIPLWLITILLLRLKDEKSSLSLCALSLAYSPWAAFNMAFIAICIVLKNIKKIKNVISTQSVLMPVLMLIVYGSFYLVHNGDVSFRLQFYPIQQILFLITQCGIFFIFIHKDRKEYKYYYVTLIYLILVTFVYSTPYFNNFIMCAAMSSLFMLMIYIIQYFEKYNHRSENKDKYLLYIIISLCSISAVSEFGISIEHLNKSNIVFDPIVSFQNNNKNDDYTLGLYKIAQNQFFGYDYQEKWFFKYIGKE